MNKARTYENIIIYYIAVYFKSLDVTILSIEDQSRELMPQKLMRQQGIRNMGEMGPYFYSG